MQRQQTPRNPHHSTPGNRGARDRRASRSDGRRVVNLGVADPLDRMPSAGDVGPVAGALAGWKVRVRTTSFNSGYV